VKSLREFGVLWEYIPNRIFTASINGYRANVRRITGSLTGEMKWRLSVDRQGHRQGIGLAWEHQFFKSAAEARSEAVRLAGISSSESRNNGPGL
jgi:hypothetical protein